MRGGAQRVQGPPRVELTVDATQPVELADIVAVDAPHLVRVGRAAHVLGRPGAQAGDEATGIHERALQLGDQLTGGRGEPGRRRRGA